MYAVAHSGEAAVALATSRESAFLICNYRKSLESYILNVICKCVPAVWRHTLQLTAHTKSSKMTILSWQSAADWAP